MAVSRSVLWHISKNLRILQVGASSNGRPSVSKKTDNLVFRTTQTFNRYKHSTSQQSDTSFRVEKSTETDLLKPKFISKVLVNNDKRILEVKWNTGEDGSFSLLFLRDSCRCPHCFNSASKQRQIDTCKDIPIDISPTSVDISDIGLKINWTDGHVSVYSHEFLLKREDFSSGKYKHLFDVSNIEPVMWNHSSLKSIPTFELNEILENEEKKYIWFENFCHTGITLLTGAEKKLGELHRVKQLFGGYVKSTHYGDLFQVAFKHDPSSLAYTSAKILPHMDLPHYLYPPGIQALHCIEQFPHQGAENTFVDAFTVVQQLKEKHPHQYQQLTNYQVLYRDIGLDQYGEFETFFERPIIGVEGDTVKSVDYSNWLRDYYMNGTADEIQQFYEAYYTFTGLINSSENVLTYKLKEGEIVIFNNRRILHGRTEYEVDPTSIAGRLLEGCYFDWDPLYWSMRPIKRRLDKRKC